MNGKMYSSVCELAGNTPLLVMSNVMNELNLKATVAAKLEYLNPAGSSKDRVACAIIADAESNGLLKEGYIIIEPTSGNTGIGLASVAASKGYKVILTMPSTMSAERIALIRAYGAEVVLTDGDRGMQGAIDEANKLVNEIPNSIIAGQFDNLSNPLAHYISTGPEIWNDTDGKVDIFVAGVGTGGTITGVGRYLKEQNKNIKVIAVEPSDSPVLSKKITGKHYLQGIGAGFVPKVLDTKIYDEIITVTTEEAYEAARLIGRREGVLVGISSGAAAHAAFKLAQMQENEGKLIAVLLPDTGDRYLSTDLFSYNH